MKKLLDLDARGGPVHLATSWSFYFEAERFFEGTRSLLTADGSRSPCSTPRMLGRLGDTRLATESSRAWPFDRLDDDGETGMPEEVDVLRRPGAGRACRSARATPTTSTRPTPARPTSRCASSGCRSPARSACTTHASTRATATATRCGRRSAGPRIRRRPSCGPSRNARGSSASVPTGSSRTRARAGTGWLLFALPLLVAFVVAVVAAHAFHPVARLLERTTRNLSVPVRLAALSLARHPAQSIAASTFLLASVGLAVFSLAYGSTLVQGQDDRARFANPAGVIVRSPQPHRVPLLGGLSPQADLWLSQKGAVPLLRLDGLVGQPSRSIEVVGISAPTLRHPPFWRDDFASRSPQGLATAIDPGRSVSLNGVRLPVAARELVMPLKMDGDPLRVVLSFRGRGDRFMDVDLRAVPSSNNSLRFVSQEAVRGGLVLGMTFAPTEPDVHNATPARGTLELGQFRVRTANGIHRLVDGHLDQWIGVGGIRSHLSRNGVAPPLLCDQRRRISVPAQAAHRPVSCTSDSDCAACATRRSEWTAAPPSRRRTVCRENSCDGSPVPHPLRRLRPCRPRGPEHRSECRCAGIRCRRRDLAEAPRRTRRGHA